MSKFTFICEDDPMPFSDGIVSKKTVEFNGESLDNIISEFEMFLKGCGFQFNGQLDFVDNHSDSFDYSEEPSEWYNEEFKTPQSDPWTKIVERHEEQLEQDYLNNIFGSSDLLCPVCKLSKKTMGGHKCWDVNCPVTECGK
jgi:hypothetical protein